MVFKKIFKNALVFATLYEYRYFLQASMKLLMNSGKAY
jgi:hypothetical protein